MDNSIINNMVNSHTSRRNNVVYDGRLEDNHQLFLEDVSDHLATKQLAELMNIQGLQIRLIPPPPPANNNAYEKAVYPKACEEHRNFVNGSGTASLRQMVCAGIATIKEHLGQNIKAAHRNTLSLQHGMENNNPQEYLDKWIQVWNLITIRIKPSGATEIQNIIQQMDNVTDEYGIRFIIAFLAEYQGRLLNQIKLGPDGMPIYINGEPWNYGRDDGTLKSILLKNLAKREETMKFLPVKQFCDMNPDTSYEEIITKINNILKSSTTTEDEIDPLGAGYNYQSFKTKYLQGKKNAVYSAINSRTNQNSNSNNSSVGSRHDNNNSRFSNGQPSNNNNTSRSFPSFNSNNNNNYNNKNSGYNNNSNKNINYNNKRTFSTFNNHNKSRFNGNCANCQKPGHRAIQCTSSYCFQCKEDFGSAAARIKHALDKHGKFSGNNKNNNQQRMVKAKRARMYEDSDFNYQENEHDESDSIQYDAEQWIVDDNNHYEQEEYYQEDYRTDEVIGNREQNDDEYD